MVITVLVSWLLLMAFAVTMRWVATSGRTWEPGSLLDLMNDRYVNHNLGRVRYQTSSLRERL